MRSAFLTLFIFAVLFLMVFATDSYAQLINHNRRAKRLKTNKVSVTINETQLAMISKKAMPEITNNIHEEIKQNALDVQVTNRIEKLYDLDGDGKLQESEIKDFYTNVISTIMKKGNFDVSSELLKSYDINDDGKISRYEARELRKNIN